MMNFEKLLFFSKAQMSPICNTLPTPPPTHHQQPFMPAQISTQAQLPTTITTTTANSTQFLTPPDVYDNVYADNFDLSLLPNEEDVDFELNCFHNTTSAQTTQNASLDFIPTTVYQHTTNYRNTPEAQEIKIESNWTNNQDVNTTNEQKPKQEQQQQEQQQLQTPAVIFEQLQQKRHQKVQRTKSAPLEIPPPPYPHQNQHYQHPQHHYQQQPYPYPSPESSPTQSDYSFHTRYSSGSYSSSYNSSYSSSLSSSYSSRGSFFPASPCSASSFERSTHIKQEFHILPPSPPESSCEAPSPHCFTTDIKTEPLDALPLDADVEKLIDINSMLESSAAYQHYDQTNTHITDFSDELEVKPDLDILTTNCQDHQLLREYLEDTTFQRKHNLKPLALESLLGGLNARGDIEPVISLALEHAKREAEETCAKLQISPDPKTWSNTQVHAWLRSTIEQFKLPLIADLELKFPDDGATLALLTEEEFVRRVPEIGSTIHAQLEIWKLAYSNGFENDSVPMSAMDLDVASSSQLSQHVQQNTEQWQSDLRPKIEMEVDEVMSDDDDDDDGSAPTSVLAVTSGACSSSSVSTSASSSTTTALAKPSGSTPSRSGGSHIHLWQFLKELLAAPHINGTAIRWIERSKGVFKIEDSVRVAKLWGRRKNRPAMNYDKLSRSIRQYYKKGIMKKTERSQRLVYQFCHPYNL